MRTRVYESTGPRAPRSLEAPTLRAFAKGTAQEGPSEVAASRLLRGPLTGRIAASIRSRAPGLTVRNADAVSRADGFESVVKRVLGRGDAIKRRDVGALLEVLDGLDPSSRHEALRALAAQHRDLAETLLLFSSAPRKDRLSAAFDHLLINTDAVVSVDATPSQLMARASRYARSIGGGGVRREGDRVVARFGGALVELCRWDPARTPSENFREIGRSLNRLRFGNETVIPPDRLRPQAAKTEGWAADRAYWSAQLSKLAYADPEVVEAQARAWGFTDFRWIDNPRTDTQAFVVGNGESAFVVFRGTSGVADFATDAQVSKTPGHGGAVHAGFHKAHESSWPEIEHALKEIAGDRPVTFTGHSLGAGLATLAASGYAARGGRVDSVYLHGSPRVGDQAFADAYNAELGAKTFLHINDADIVTRLPPSFWGYVEVGQRRVFDSDGNLYLEAKAQTPDGRASAPADAESLPRDLDAAVRAIRAEGAAMAAHALPTTSGDIPFGPVADHASQNYVRLLGEQAMAAALGIPSAEAQ